MNEKLPSADVWAEEAGIRVAVEQIRVGVAQITIYDINGDEPLAQAQVLNFRWERLRAALEGGS
jgi:hypothetical protein